MKEWGVTTWSNLSLLSPPVALGPLDGRYRGATATLVNHLSEPALNRARIHVEVEWFIHLADTGAVPGVEPLTDGEREFLRSIPSTFGQAAIDRLAELERETVHDVKAVEYYIKEQLTQATSVVGKGSRLPDVGELVHFACTSEDINNLSYAVMIRGAVQDVWLPSATALVDALATMAREHADQPMLSRTHGQSATPTTLGKEIAVFAHRLSRQVGRIRGTAFMGKINGATGTFGAHTVALPQTDWISVSRTFVEHLGLTWNPLTTQIESHDWQAELYSDIARFNRIAHNLATDMWAYISLGYFAQVRGQGTIGSSAMPHKVNPIRFENAEANLELSCALLDSLASTLVTSRMQRDLTDSTTQRNIGVAFGHSLLAIDNLLKGLAGVDVDASALDRDLDATWEVLAEPIQSAMRAAGLAGADGMDSPYERLRDLTRGQRVTQESMKAFIATLGLPAEIEQRLIALTPRTYTGLAKELVALLDV